MQKLLAISGGIDSVCLLHMYKDDPEITMIHFNHGTRPSSNDDEEFVKELAKKYDKRCIIGRAELGEHAPEALARKFRYDFFKNVLESGDFTTILTAHHLDDLVETIAINLLRGTGWRGLAPFSQARVSHPFFGRYGTAGL